LRNLLLAFDGTWQKTDADLSDGDQNSHVVRLVEALHNSDSDLPQLVHYLPGVGTSAWQQIRGGIFGWGLSDKIAEAYLWLMEHYQAGDRVYLVGYSRGAFAARSLSGLIDRLGLLRLEHLEQFDSCYQLYRRGTRRDQNRFKAQFATPIQIEAIAVWDTVGSLGIPLGSFKQLNRYLWGFHDTRLASNVKRGFQALAIDEHRADFIPTLWSPKLEETQGIEQRWFAGSHGDVGGGTDSTLSTHSYQWICESLIRSGLQLDAEPVNTQISNVDLPNDSFDQFLGGLYDWFSDRHWRPIGACQNRFETIDPSVFELINNTSYRPKNRVGPYLSSSISHYLCEIDHLYQFQTCFLDVEEGILNAS
jgi:uncharacterized protein (DUF2235 family)